MFKTYPYFFAGIGANSHIRYGYEIDDKELRLTDRFGSTTIVQLPPTSVDIIQTLPQKILGIGDVIVHKQGREPVTCRKISNPFNFKAALYGEHPDVQSGKKAEPEWYANLKDDDLEDFEIVIPAITAKMFNVLYEVKLTSSHHPTYEIAEGLFAKKDQLISQYSGHPDSIRGAHIGSFFKSMISSSSNTTNVIAPIKGKIGWGHQIGSHTYWSTETGQPINTGPSDYAFFVKIRPLKGEIIPPNATYLAYEGIINWFEQILREDKLIKQIAGPNGVDSLRKDLDLLKTHKTLIQAVRKPEINLKPGNNI